MERLSFVLSLLLIVSVTTTFGSVIKAKNPTEEVKKWTYVIAHDLNFLLVILEGVSREFPWHFWFFFLFRI